MTLSLRWDASDTVFISGPPSDRYVHWPLEISSNTSSFCNVSVWLYDNANTEIVSQTYEGVPISSEWGKFNPAILVPDSYFATPQSWTLKALIYTSSVPIETPRQITKTIQNTALSSGGSRIIVLVAAAGLVYFLSKKRFFK